MLVEIFVLDNSIDPEAKASTSASSLVGNRPARERRGSISNRGRWTQRQNLPRKRNAKAGRWNGGNAPGNSEATGTRYARVARYKNRFGFGSGKPTARKVDRGRIRKKGLADLP